MIGAQIGALGAESAANAAPPTATGKKGGASKAQCLAAHEEAQKLRGDMGGLKAVSSSLNRAKSVVDVATAVASDTAACSKPPCNEMSCR